MRTWPSACPEDRLWRSQVCYGLSLRICCPSFPVPHPMSTADYFHTEYTFSCIACGSMPLHQSGALHSHYTTPTFANQCAYILTSLSYKACSNHARIELSAFFTMLLSILHSFSHAFIKTRGSSSQSHRKTRDQSSIAYCLSLNCWSTHDSLWKGKCLSFLKLAVSYFE